MTIKYNSSGTQQWAPSYNGSGSGEDIGNDIAVDGSGNVYVTGTTTSGLTGNDFVTIKYNSSGTEQWSSVYNGPANGRDVAVSIVVDGSGNVYVTGTSVGSGTSEDYATIKYNSSGVQQWASRYNGSASGTDEATSIGIDGSGNVYVTGSAYSGDDGGQDFATIKYNSSGAQQWASIFDGPDHDYDKANELVVISSGSYAGVYVSGTSDEGNNCGGDCYLDYQTVKYALSDGAQLLEVHYNDCLNSNDGVTGLAVSSVYGIIYTTGYKYKNVSSCSVDYSTQIWESDGTEISCLNLNGSGNGYDRANDIVIREIDGCTFPIYFITGYTTNSNNNKDYTTVYYYHVSWCRRAKINTHESFNLNNYPNPFNPKTNINYTLDEAGFVSLKIYDVNGKEIAILVDGYKDKGDFTVEFDGSNLSSGLYIYKFESDGKSVVKKMLLIK